jgi:hypothetical protein
MERSDLPPRARATTDERELRQLLDELDEIDLDELAAEMDRSISATWCRDLRRLGVSYRAIGEHAGVSGAKVRREIARLERRLTSI